MGTVPNRKIGWGRCSALLLVCVFAVQSIPRVVSAQTPDSVVKQAALESELSDINEEIKGLTNTITGLKNEGQSLDRDIKLLNANIERANLNIKAKNLQIARLGDGIKDKTRTVLSLEKRIEREKQSLAQLIRKTNELDQASMAEMLLSGHNLSDFFLDLDSFDSIRSGLKSSSLALGSAIVEASSTRAALEVRQSDEEDARAELERNRKIVQSNEEQKKRLLNITKNKEREYKGVLVDRKRRAAEIRAALFALRDAGEIQFGRALDYANTVSDKTGIRPAFLLAIFMQESSFGREQGSCLLKNKETGAGTSIKTGNAKESVMKPSRDVAPFFDITAKLGLDPYNTRVSCPQEAGWGGAMGAAQFIPSTWVMFEGRITKALGTDVADPWSARDAFMAAGLYLTDLGAKSASYSAERDAACKYFSGRRCSQSAWASTYGNQVMKKAETIQTTMIDPLQNT